MGDMNNRCAQLRVLRQPPALISIEIDNQAEKLEGWLQKVVFREKGLSSLN
jgi:hypothetical protein